MPGVQLCTLDRCRSTPLQPLWMRCMAPVSTGHCGRRVPQPAPCWNAAAGTAPWSLLQTCPADAMQTPEPPPRAVRADVTVTFDSCKPVHFSAPDIAARSSAPTSAYWTPGTPLPDRSDHKAAVPLVQCIRRDGCCFSNRQGSSPIQTESVPFLPKNSRMPWLKLRSPAHTPCDTNH